MVSIGTLIKGFVNIKVFDLYANYISISPSGTPYSMTLIIMFDNIMLDIIMLRYGFYGSRTGNVAFR